jgi:hypothetical protein
MRQINQTAQRCYHSLAGKTLISESLSQWKCGILGKHQTPMHVAAKEGHRNIMELIIGDDDLQLDSQNENGKTPLSWAVEGGHASVAQLLLDKGVEINSYTISCQAIRKDTIQ